ncbi:MAG: hypothetical protein RBT74_11390 [Tenuifilaceae bacterium]|jgi:hypothetical protein|nr:hypothetical protein [Tenuifilaceae bacterium]
MCNFSKLRFFVVFSLLFASFALSVRVVNGQGRAKSKDVIVDSLFRNRDYGKAIDYLNELLLEYPQEPTYHYMLGVSYVNATKNFTKAIEHLDFASTKEVPNLVYYYLGIAKHRSYKFDEAISYYRRFVISGGDPSISNQQIELLVSQCENGNFMLRYVYQPKILDRKPVSHVEVNQFLITKSSEGNFIPTPKDLLTPTDIKQNHSSFIFYPNNPKPGDRIVYSSYGNTTSFGKDLFMIEMLNDGFWSKPQNLGEIVNSKYDEDFPYLSSDGQTLYFASRGHYSMGGYDIYRSVYNSSARQWSTPENLGFPFSSTYNDYLYVPDNADEMAIFVTDRNLNSDSLEVVLVKVDQNPIRRTIDSNETIRSIAQLTPEVAVVQRPTVEVEKPAESKPQQVAKTATFSAVENDPEYARALAGGFTQQMRADSLRSKLETLRARFDNITTAEARRNLEAQVVVVEDNLLIAQRNADLFFAQASQIEQEYLTGKRKPIDKPTSTFTTDHPDFLYQAQFAPTVFQADELSRLAQLERSAPQIQRLRDQIAQSQAQLNTVKEQYAEESAEYADQYKKHLDLLKRFNVQLAPNINRKKKLYSDCISVALIKAGANNNLDIKGHIDRANTHFRSATAIRNNATKETMVESEYEALLIDELGVLRLEIAFAKLWEMQLFEQQLLSRVYKLEQSIFGYTLPSESTTPPRQTIVESKPIESTVQKPLIVRMEAQTIEAEEFTFEQDKEPPFKLLDKSPYSKDNPFEKHDPLPEGVFYKIQMAAFSRPIAFDFFKGLSPISGEPVNDGRVTKYYVGKFSSLSEAEKALPIVRSQGFKDAFIVAWHNGRSITLTRAKGLEEVSALRSSGPVSRDTTRIEIAKDNKHFVIQLGAYSGRLPADIAQTIRALAPGKDIVRKPDNQGGFVYSIGSYSDLNEANRIKDNLVASGIKSAFVVAVDLDN